MSFVSSSSEPSIKSIPEPHILDVCIEKPRTLTETCPVETTTERLPHIEERVRRKKQIKQTRKSSEPEERWLKSGLSLPKLQPREVSRPVRSRKRESVKHLYPVEFGSVTSFKAIDPSTEKSSIYDVSLSPKSDRDRKQEEGEESATISPMPVGPSASRSEFRVPSSELNFDEYKVEEEEIEESHALRRWEFWLKEHKHLQEQLRERLQRNKCGLLFQQAQRYRMVTRKTQKRLEYAELLLTVEPFQRVEDKSLFFLAQIPAADKWRGHPFFWKFPNKIGSRENLLRDEESIPACYEAQTKLEKGEKPEMEFIGMPAVIKKEKGLHCDYYLIDSNWEKLPYRQDRLRDFRKETLNLKPHDIQMDGLEIVGTKIPKKERGDVILPAEIENLPQIKMSPAEPEDSCPRDFYADRSSVFWLSIGGKESEYAIGNEYCQKTPKNEIDLTWEIDFGVNNVGVLIERTLRVENKGTIAVEYNFLFQKLDEKCTLNSLQPKQHEPCFFFNKNTGIFLPGQIYNLKFYHYAKRSGVRKEIWNLKTQPPLSRNGQNGTIVLWAVSGGDSLDSAINALDSYLKKRVTLSTVSFILEILIRKALNPLEELEDIEYRSFFLEKDLFEYQNPKHYYHSLIVKELRRIFEQIPCQHQVEWDLSIASLTELTMIYIKGKEQDYLLRQISEKAKKLLRPNFLLVKNIKKYRMTYEILCKMSDLMDEDYHQLRNCLVQRKEQARTTPSQFEEMGEGLSIRLEEKETVGEFWDSSAEMTLEIKPIDTLFFQTMYYLRAYHRVAEAIDQVAAALETSNITEPWKKIDPRLTKPSRERRE